MTQIEKEQMIYEAAELCFAAHVEPEMEPISTHLVAQGYKYGRDFCFVLCVATEVGHMHARVEGYKDQWDRAGQLYAARHVTATH